MSAIGRNDRCPCGSGLKFKKCCLLNGSKGIIEASVQKLKERVKQQSKEHGEKEVLCFRDLKNVKKMSEIIIEFAQPILRTAESFEMQKRALSVAMIAWNMSLMDDFNTQLEKLCNEMNKPYDKQFASDKDSIILFLIQRRLELYPDVKRLVMDYDIIDTGNGLHLNVVSSPLNDDSEADIFEKEAERLSDSGEGLMSLI